jgi:hypothetical protein
MKVKSNSPKSTESKNPVNTVDRYFQPIEGRFNNKNKNDTSKDKTDVSEDVVDGFLFLSFDTFADLQRFEDDESKNRHFENEDSLKSRQLKMQTADDQVNQALRRIGQGQFFQGPEVQGPDVQGRVVQKRELSPAAANGHSPGEPEMPKTKRGRGRPRKNPSQKFVFIFSYFHDPKFLIL